MSTALFVQPKQYNSATGRWEPTGKPTINPRKLYIQHFSLTPEPPNDVLTIAANSLGPPMVFKGPQEGVWEGFQMMLNATSAANLLLAVMDHRNTRRLNSGLLSATSLFGLPITPNIGAGNGAYPFYLPETLWLRPTETLVMQFQNLSQNPNIIRPVIHGRLYVRTLPDSMAANANAVDMAEKLNMTTAPFFYTTNTQPLSDGVAAVGISALAAVNTTINIANDGAFELSKITGMSTGSFTLQLFDPFSGRALSSRPIHSDLIVGNGPFPYILPEPLFMRRSSYWNMVITDLSNAPNSIYLTFSGRRVYSGDEAL